MTETLTGGCDCGTIRYGLQDRPLIVHCCHCHWCQRETGSAFAVNALIETDRVELLAGATDEIDTPSESGKGQVISRCPQCRIAVWSVYSGLGPKIRFIRVGTLDNPALCEPDVHIFTQSKLPWIRLPEDRPAFEGYYRRSNIWTPQAQARWAAALAKQE